MVNWKKFKKFVKKVAKPVAAVAAIVYPPLIPLIGSALGATGAATAVVGAAALSGAASAVSGDKPKDILKNAVLGGAAAGIVQAVAPTAFDKGLLSGGGGAAATTAPATTAATTASTGTGLLSGSAGTGLTAGSTGTGLTLGSGGATGLTAGGGSLGLTAASPGAAAIGGSLGTTLSAINTGVNAAGVAGALSGAGSAVGSVTPANYSLASTPAAAATGGTGILNTIKSAGSSVLDFAKQNPQLTGAAIGAITGAIDAKNAPKEQTTTTSIDPEIKAKYMENLGRAETAAANLGVRQYAEPGQMYTDAEKALYNLGMTPFGAADIEAFYNPYESQVIEGSLGDIERSRLMQDVADRARATQARAFGGSRQGVVSALTNEAALRTAASTASGLRSAGFNTAANLGLAARPLNISGLQTSLGLGSQRDALAQARLDAARNLPLERLGITGGALGLQPANTGGTTSQPLYTSGAGSALSGGLTGAYIGSLLKPP